MSAALSPGAGNVARLLATYAEQVDGVEHAVAVAPDGLLMATSTELDRNQGDTLAAIIGGLRALADGAARVLHRGGSRQVVVEMHSGYLLATTLAGGVTLGTLTERDADLGVVGYEAALLAERVGAQLTPELVAELKRAL